MLCTTKCWWIRNARRATHGLISWVLEVKSPIGLTQVTFLCEKNPTPLMTFEITVKWTGCFQICELHQSAVCVSHTHTHYTLQFNMLESVSGRCKSVCETVSWLQSYPNANVLLETHIDCVKVTWFRVTTPKHLCVCALQKTDDAS